MLDTEFAEDVLPGVGPSVEEVGKRQRQGRGVCRGDNICNRKSQAMSYRPGSLVPDSAGALCFIAPSEIQSFPRRAFAWKGEIQALVRLALNC